MKKNKTVEIDAEIYDFLNRMDLLDIDELEKLVDFVIALIDANSNHERHKIVQQLTGFWHGGGGNEE